MSQPITLKMNLQTTDLNVDVENRRLNGVIAIEPIDIKDWREFTINEEFITDLVSLANKSKSGVKSYFGHNWANEGKLLGRAKNWRIENGKAKYDLYILSSSDKSPVLPGMGSYVLETLAEDKEAMMNSIVFREDYFYQEDASGNKLRVYYWDEKSESYIMPNPDMGKVYPKIKELYSTDIVSEGAATNSMFSHENEKPGKMQKLISAIRDFFDLSSDDDQAAHIFSQQNTETMDTTPSTPSPELTQTEAQLLQAENAALKAQLQELTKNITSTPEDEETPATPADVISQLQAQIDELKQKLSATPAASPVQLNDGADGGEHEAKPWENDPINKAAIEYFSQFPKRK